MIKIQQLGDHRIICNEKESLRSLEIFFGYRPFTLDNRVITWKEVMVWWAKIGEKSNDQLQIDPIIYPELVMIRIYDKERNRFSQYFEKSFNITPVFNVIVEFVQWWNENQ